MRREKRERWPPWSPGAEYWARDDGKDIFARLASIERVRSARRDRRCCKHEDCLADHALGAVCWATRRRKPWAASAVCQGDCCVGPVRPEWPWIERLADVSQLRLDGDYIFRGGEVDDDHDYYQRMGDRRTEAARLAQLQELVNAELISMQQAHALMGGPEAFGMPPAGMESIRRYRGTPKSPKPRRAPEKRGFFAASAPSPMRRWRT